MSKNEHTSARVAKIAGFVLAVDAASDAWAEVWDCIEGGYIKLRWKDIRALAASCLTQTADADERETLRRGKLPKGHKRTKVHEPVLRRLNHK